jgi:hypothetical protein
MVSIDKFTKWIKYKPIALLIAAKAAEFIQEIIFRFGLPNSIITILGCNFTRTNLFDFCEQKCILVKDALVAHPRANSQVWRANRMILDALKKMVFDKSEKPAGKWIREITYVIWSLRTQPSTPRHYPFLHGAWLRRSATYGLGVWGT